MRRLQAIALVTTPLALRLTSAIEPTAEWYRHEQAQDVHILAAHPPHYAGSAFCVNWASSVDPDNAATELSPPVIQFITRSK